MKLKQQRTPLKTKKMKNLAVVIFVFAMSVTTTFANNDDKRKEEVKNLRTQIVQLLGNYSSAVNVKAEVTFMINKKGEIVIVSVNSESNDVQTFVKNKLNYKRVKNTNAKRMEIYKMPLKIVKA